MDDILSSWAGLRPLVADPNGKPSDISRSHEIHNPQAGWWDVAGGKLTTYRLMAEQVSFWMAECLGWEESTRTEELARHKAHCDGPQRERGKGRQDLIPKKIKNKLTEKLK